VDVGLRESETRRVVARSAERVAFFLEQQAADQAVPHVASLAVAALLASWVLVAQATVGLGERRVALLAALGAEALALRARGG
jgi:hypothetical protein